MLEFTGHVLELSMPVERGIKDPLGHLLVQVWTDNNYLNLRALFRALFGIIRRSPEEFFLQSENSPASFRPSVKLSVCKHSLLSHLLQDHWSDLF